MLTYLRYALASVCFAASVGCLSLWWRSGMCLDRAQGPIYIVPHQILDLTSFHGIAEVMCFHDDTGQIAEAGWVRPRPTTDPPELDLLDMRSKGAFGYSEVFERFYFPLWYPALVFALAGVGVIGFRRQFSIRSALIWLTVVAALLGMAVGL